MFDLEYITRKNISKLVAYSSARTEFRGEAGIFLDANENALGAPLTFSDVDSLNRYPDPLQRAVKDKLGRINDLLAENIFLGNGSDEAIDILFRAFCEPGKDNVIICPPTYGMYEVAANINNVQVLNVPLLPETFELDEQNILKAIGSDTRLIFICSPNNPTGTAVSAIAIRNILEKFNGIVVVDEAYIHFAGYDSLVAELGNYPNLVVLQTMSKAWGLAGLRVGMAFASAQIVELFNKIKPPYNINGISQKLVLKALDKHPEVNSLIKKTIGGRNKLFLDLSDFPFIIKVYESEANFILVKVKNAVAVYNFLAERGIVVRNRGNMTHCEGCLRITVGTISENEKLISILNEYGKI